MGVLTRGKTWYVDFRLQRKRYRLKSPDNSKHGAECFEARLRHEFAVSGTVSHLLKPLERKTFGKFAKEWLETYVQIHNKHSERYSKKKILAGHLVPFFGSTSLEDISTAHIEAYKKRELESGVSKKTVNNRLTVLRKCLNSAQELGELEVVPKIRQFKLGATSFTYLEERDVQCLLVAAATEQERTLILVAVRTGLRISELRALRWQDVDFTRSMISVTRALVYNHLDTPKNGRVRHVPITKEVAQVLRRLPHDGELVFHRNRQPLAYWTITHRLHQACARAGIKRIGWHVFRHTFASHLASRGAPLAAIKDLLGHSTVNMTMRYAHLSPNVLRGAIDLLDPEKWAPDGHSQSAPPSHELHTTTTRAFEFSRE